MDFRLIHHHVGARGNVPLPLDTRSPIRGDFAVFYYDADEDALTDALRERIQVGKSSLLPYCLGARSEKRAFHIANDSYSSSLYPFNTKYQNFTKATYLGQSRMGDSHATARQIDVDVVTLDEICAPNGDIPAPDFLSIDVEGAELDIIRGSAGCLRDSVVWLRSEMWIHPVYDGAATMEVSMAYLRDAGFDLFHMAPYGEYEADKLTFGMHGLGQTLGAEVDFHCQVDAIVNNAENGRDAAILKLYKLALLTFMQGGNGLGYQALKQADALGGTFFTKDNATKPANYLAFLEEAWIALQNMTKHLPVFPDLGQATHRKRERVFRFKNADNQETRDRLISEDREERKEIENNYKKMVARVHKLAWMPATPLETIFRKYGLVDQANEMSAKRKQHCENFISLFYSLGEGPLR